MLDLLLHELLQNDPGAEMDKSKQVHDILRSVLFEDYALNQEHIAERDRTVH